MGKLTWCLIRNKRQEEGLWDGICEAAESKPFAHPNIKAAPASRILYPWYQHGVWQLSATQQLQQYLHPTAGQSLKTLPNLQDQLLFINPWTRRFWHKITTPPSSTRTAVVHASSSTFAVVNLCYLQGQLLSGKQEEIKILTSPLLLRQTLPLEGLILLCMKSLRKALSWNTHAGQYDFGFLVFEQK